MSIPRDNLAASLRDLAGESRSQQSVHPKPDELLDYHAGRISDDDKERVQDHLAACPTCAKAVLDIASFPEIEPDNPDRRLSGEQVASEWQNLQQRLADDEKLADIAIFKKPEKPATDHYSTHRLYALAATFVAACLGLAFWNVSLRNEIRELRQPRFNVATTSLVAMDDTVRGAGTEAVSIPDGEQLLVYLPFFWPEAEASYDVTLLDSRGAVVYHANDLRQTTGEAANVFLPKGSLAAGKYRIRIARPGDAEGPLFKEFILTIH